MAKNKEKVTEEQSLETRIKKNGILLYIVGTK